jgi:hypothetical protein
LFHKTEKRQIDDLKTDAIEVINDVIPAKDRADWLVWREGFATWKPLEDFPNLLASLRKGGMMNAPSQPAPAPAQRDVATRLAGDVKVGGAAAAAQPASAPSSAPSSAPTPASSEPAAPAPATTVQDRLARQGNLDESVEFDLIAEYEAIGSRDDRYPKKWQIRILTDGKPIVLTTNDVSLRGFSLREPLPKGLPRYFNVEVVAGNIVVPLICSEIPSKTGASTRLKIEVNHDPSLFQTALLQ